MAREAKAGGERPLGVEQIAMPIYRLTRRETRELESGGDWDEGRLPAGCVLLTWARRVDPKGQPRSARWCESVAGGGAPGSALGIAAMGEACERLAPLAGELLDRMERLGLWARMARGQLGGANPPVSRMDLESVRAAGVFVGMDVGAGQRFKGEALGALLRAACAEAEAFAQERGLEGAAAVAVSFEGLAGFGAGTDDAREAARALEGLRAAEERAVLGAAAAPGRAGPGRRGI